MEYADLVFPLSPYPPTSPHINALSKYHLLAMNDGLPPFRLVPHPSHLAHLPRPAIDILIKQPPSTDLSLTRAATSRQRSPSMSACEIASMTTQHLRLQSYQPFQTNFGHLGYHCRSRCLALPFRGPSIPEGCLEEDPIRKSIVYTKDPLLNVLFLIVSSTLPSPSPSPPPFRPCLPTLWINANLALVSSIVHPAYHLSETPPRRPYTLFAKSHVHMCRSRATLSVSKILI
jgi:hypothetical protein